MTSLPRFSVNNPVLVNLMMLSILVGGAYCALTLVREMFPESRPRRILITTAYPGASPQEVEKGITLKIEEKVREVEGVDKIISTIDEGHSTILVEMESGFDKIDQAVNDAKAGIDTIPLEDFPEEAKETRVAKFEPRWPVISVSLYGDLDDRMLKVLGDRLRSEILLLPGITNVVLSGTRKDEISVEVGPEKLVKFGLSFLDVAHAIEASNLDLPAGQVRTLRSNIAVRTLGEKDRGEELNEIVVRSDPGGRTIHLRDVATIVDGFEDVEVAGRFGGEPAVRITVYKTAEQDAISIAHMVRTLVAAKMGRPLKRDWDQRFLALLTGDDLLQKVYTNAKGNPLPAGVGVAVHTDLSRFIEDRLDLLKRNGFWGLILVTLSLLVFLHRRIAFWVMMGLLLAVAGSLIGMRLLGQTLNLISMFGLIIVLGLLVDDAIIVSEHVYSKVEQGEDPKVAAISGAEEVTAPVVCAILTTITAFIPLMFIQGQMGEWMGVLPVIVCLALSVSLLEALMILPSHLAHGLPVPMTSAPGAGPRRSGVLSRLSARARAAQNRYVVVKLRRVYERILRTATEYRYVTMGILTAMLIISLGVVAGGHVPFVFLPKMDSETVVANLKMGVGTPMSATRTATNVIEQAALDLTELKDVYTLLGRQMSDDGMVTTPQSHLSQVFMELVPASRRQRTSDEIVQEIREKTADIPGVEKLRFSSIQGGPTGLPFHLEISGDRLDDLIAVSERIRSRLRRFEGVFDIVDDFDAGRPEVQIELFESARALGLTTQSLATQVRAAFYGYETRKVQRGREDVRIMVRYPPESRRRIYDIESMRIATPRGTLVPFTEVARLREGTGYASIHRTNQRQTITVTADVDSDITTADKIIAAISAEFPALKARYPEVQLEFGGQKLETRRSFASLKRDFVAALLMIYAILAGLFRSYVQPLMVMSIIPYGIIGAVVGHFVMGYQLTVLSMIGLVALTGIVVNDSMILLMFINQRVSEGMPAAEAVIEGGKSRLRAILLTSATTVLGIAPLLAETSFQARFLIPMGVSISAGLIFATVLTLVGIPSLYLITIDVKRLYRKIVEPKSVNDWNTDGVNVQG